ncbi:hypothetical protein GCM10020256_01310 [Streptomyces thermocoprophilus]
MRLCPRARVEAGHNQPDLASVVFDRRVPQGLGASSVGSVQRVHGSDAMGNEAVPCIEAASPFVGGVGRDLGALGPLFSGPRQKLLDEFAACASAAKLRTDPTWRSVWLS